MHTSFHLSFPVKSIGVTKMFYNEILGCPVGRSSEHWVDFDFFGNQISAHISDAATSVEETTEVDGKPVPLRHFGAILSVELWRELVQKLRVAGTEFILEPQIRYAGQPGEQHIVFVRDPSGNALEFKAFTNSQEVFQRQSQK
jgi:extradiol dioxygenase family protein